MPGLIRNIVHNIANHHQPAYSQQPVYGSVVYTSAPLVTEAPLSATCAPHTLILPSAQPSSPLDEENKLGASTIRVTSSSGRWQKVGLEIDVPIEERPSFSFNGKSRDDSSGKVAGVALDGIRNIEDNHIRVERALLSDGKHARYTVFFHESERGVYDHNFGFYHDGPGSGAGKDKAVIVTTGDGTRHLLNLQGEELLNSIQKKAAPVETPLAPKTAQGSIKPQPTPFTEPVAAPKAEPDLKDVAVPKMGDDRNVPPPMQMPPPEVTTKPRPDPQPKPTAEPGKMPVPSKDFPPVPELKPPTDEPPLQKSNPPIPEEKKPAIPATPSPVVPQDSEPPPIVKLPEKAPEPAVHFGKKAAQQLLKSHFGDLDISAFSASDGKHPLASVMAVDTLALSADDAARVERMIEKTNISKRPVGSALEHKQPGNQHRMVLRKYGKDVFALDTSEIHKETDGYNEGLVCDSLVFARSESGKWFMVPYTRLATSFHMGREYKMTDRVRTRLSWLETGAAKSDGQTLTEYSPERPFYSNYLAPRASADSVASRVPTHDLPFCSVNADIPNMAPGLAEKVERVMDIANTLLKKPGDQRLFEQNWGHALYIEKLDENFYSITTHSQLRTAAGTAQNVDVMLVRRAKDGKGWEIAQLEFNGTDYVADSQPSRHLTVDSRYTHRFSMLESGLTKSK